MEPAPVARSTFWRPSHCPVHRNEQRGLAPRVYIDNNTRWQLAAIATVYHQRGLYFIHLKWGVPVALFLTNRWICEVLRMSKPKRPENAFFYMSIPHSPTSGTNLRLCHKVKKNIQYIKIYLVKNECFLHFSLIFGIIFVKIQYKKALLHILIIKLAC